MRLNAAMKSQVLDKAMAHRFKKQEADVNKEAQAIGMALWGSLFGQYKRLLVKVPKEFLSYPRMSRAGDKFGGVNFTIGGQYHIYPLPLDLPIPNSGERTVRLTIKDNALIERHRAYLAAAEQLKSDKQKVSGTLSAMLVNIQTFRRLETDWPEGKPFYHSLPADFPFNHQVPAVQVKELNALLGLAA